MNQAAFEDLKGLPFKTAKLTGAALDWAVAVAIGAVWNPPSTRPEFFAWPTTSLRYSRGTPKYSTDWAQGGPIIEREKICVLDTGDAAKWKAYRWLEVDFGPEQFGTTPLIAAMRCFVYSELGDEVDVPKELLP